MPITDPTARFGLRRYDADSNSFAQLRDTLTDIVDGMETRGVRIHTAILPAAKPTPTAAMIGDFCWDGRTLWHCDFTATDGDPVSATPAPRWRAVSTDWYVNVQDYGARPLPPMTRYPATPVPLGANYDPAAFIRSYDCAPAIEAAFAASRAPSGSLSYPAGTRRSKPIFFPPGHWLIARSVILASGAGFGASDDVSVIGCWPYTSIRVLGNVVGTDGAGATATKPGVTGAVLYVGGTFRSVHIEGLKFLGPVDTDGPVSSVASVFSAIDIEADARITIRDIEVEPTLECASALELNHGAGTTANVTERTVVENVVIRGQGPAYASRTGSGALVPWYTGISVGSGRGALMRNVHVERYSRGVLMASFNLEPDCDVEIDGITFRDNGFTDMLVVGPRTVTVHGLASRGSARLIDILSVPSGESPFVRISGVFDCAASSWPAESTSDAGADFARVRAGVLVLDKFRIRNASGRIRTIGVDNSIHPVFLRVVDSLMPAEPHTLVRIIAGTEAPNMVSGIGWMQTDPTSGAVVAVMDALANLTVPVGVIGEPPSITGWPAGSPTHTAELTPTSDINDIRRVVASLAELMVRVGAWRRPML